MSLITFGVTKSLNRVTASGQEAPYRATLPAGTPSDFRLLGDFESVVDLDAEVPHSAFELRMTKQQLHGSQIPGSPIDERRLRTPDRVRAVRRRIKADLFDPTVHNASVLPRAEVRRRMQSTREQIVFGPECRRLDPCFGASRVEGVISNWTGRCVSAGAQPRATLPDRHGTHHGRVASRDRSREAYYQYRG